MDDPRALLTRHFTEDIPDVNLGEVSVALRQLKNGRALGDDGVITELLQAESKLLLTALARLFNAIIQQGIAPEAWSRSAMV